MLTLQYSVTTKHAFIFVASVDSVINVRVRSEDVHCGSYKVIF